MNEEEKKEVISIFKKGVVIGIMLLILTIITFVLYNQKVHLKIEVYKIESENLKSIEKSTLKIDSLNNEIKTLSNNISNIDNEINQIGNSKVLKEIIISETTLQNQKIYSELANIFNRVSEKEIDIFINSSLITENK